MGLFTILLVLQTLLLGTAYSKSGGAISPSSSTKAAGFTFHFPFLSGAKTASPDPVASSTSTSPTPPSSIKSYLTCDPPFPMTDVAGSDFFIETCTLVGREIILILTHMDITEEHLRYLDPKLPKELLALKAYVHFLEIQHDCRTAHQETTHCAWLLQLRGDIPPLLAKMGGPEIDGQAEIDEEILLAIMVSILSDGEQLFSELIQITTELIVLEWLDLGLSQGLSVLAKKLDKFGKLVGRAEALEKNVGCPERGLPVVCDTLGKIRESAERLLVGPRLEKALMDVKDEL